MEQPKEAELLPIPEQLWEIKGTEVRRLTWLARHPKNPRYAIYMDDVTEMPVRVYLPHTTEETLYHLTEAAAQNMLRRQLLAVIEGLPIFGLRKPEIFSFQEGVAVGYTGQFEQSHLVPPTYTILDMRDGQPVLGFPLAVTNIGFRVTEALGFPVKIIFA